MEARLETQEEEAVLVNREPSKGASGQLVEKVVADPEGWRTWLQGRVLMGVAPDAELGAILVVYFIQGFLGLSRLALSFFLKDELHLEPTQVAVVTGLSTLPWLIKPVYGFVSDAIPLAGYRRRSYLIIAGLLGASAWAYMALWTNSEWETVVATVIASGSVALSDVVADSMVVERARKEEPGVSGALQSLCWTASSLGGLLSAYFSGSLIALLGTRQVFGITATLPLVTASLAGLIEEQVMAFRVDQILAGFRRETQALWEALQLRSVWVPTLCLFLWQATPNVDSALFFFSTNELHFDAEFLGRVRLVSSAAALAGTLLYQRFLRKVPVSDVLFGATLLSVPIGLTQLILVTHFNRVLGIPDAAFALTDSALLAALGYVAFMPTLVLAARICPPGVEGALFATLMSVYNGASLLSTELGALLIKAFHVTEVDFGNLPLLVALCNVIPLVTLPLIAATKPVVEGSAAAAVAAAAAEREERK